MTSAIRSYQIDAPIIGEHAWRQADTASVARNFAEHGYRILHPQIDWGGETPGDVESEFPLYPFAVALLYGLFDVDEIWARGLSLAFSAFTVLFLYGLVREHTDETTALWSCALFAILPLNAFFGRAVMPEALMLMASAAGLDYFSRWMRTRRLRCFLLSALFVCTACLVKLPCLYLGAPLLYLAWLGFGPRVFWTPMIWLYGALVLAPVALWYWHAHQLFLDTGLSFGIWGYGTDKWGNWDLVLDWKYWNRVLLNRLAHRHLTWVGSAVFVAGLFLKRRSREEWVFDAWLLGLAVYLVVVGRGNYAHNYYQLPVLLPAVVFMGKVFARYFGRPRLRSPTSVALALGLGAIAALSGIQLRSLWEDENPERSNLYQLASRLEAVSEPSDRVISVGGDPTLLYLAHRKGWKAPLGSLSPENVAQKTALGAAYVAGIRPRRGWSESQAAWFRYLETEHDIVLRDGRAFIVRLRPPG